MINAINLVLTSIGLVFLVWMIGIAIYDLATRPRDRFSLLHYIRHQQDWSSRTFGPGERTAGIIDHIRKELDEVAADPRDVTEWCDVIILALDGAWRAGASPEYIIAALKRKARKNRLRHWPDWRKFTQNDPIEHVRDRDMVQEMLNHIHKSGDIPVGIGATLCDEPEWIKWDGGRCPIPDAKWYELKFQNGHCQIDDECSSHWNWEHDCGGGDIVAYRVFE